MTIPKYSYENTHSRADPLTYKLDESFGSSSWKSTRIYISLSSALTCARIAKYIVCQYHFGKKCPGEESVLVRKVSWCACTIRGRLILKFEGDIYSKKYGNHIMRRTLELWRCENGLSEVFYYLSQKNYL